MNDERCVFCGEHPFEWVNVEVGYVPVAVVCCEWGWCYYDGGSDYDYCGMPFKEILAMMNDYFDECEKMTKEKKDK